MGKINVKDTYESTGTWELTNNPDFKAVEFDHFKSLELDLF